MSDSRQVTSLTTATGTYLLDGLRDPDNRTVWQDFVDRYRVVVIRYACRLGLRDAEAEDAAQQTLLAFSTAYKDGKYDREKGRLRDWLFGIARNQIKDILRKQRDWENRLVDGLDRTAFLDRPGGDDRLEKLWEEQWQESVVRACVDEVRRTFDLKTIEAFQLFAWKGWPARRVGEHLNLSDNAVFLARYRVLRRIRRLLPQMEEVW